MTREDLVHTWRMKKVDEAIACYRHAIEQLEHDFQEEVRKWATCRKCGKSMSECTCGY